MMTPGDDAKLYMKLELLVLRVLWPYLVWGA